MGYKILGFAVWRASKWYVRRKMPGTRGQLAIAAVSAAVVGGVAAAGRQQSKA